MSETVYDFKGRTAIVTGATKGIGRDIALALARAGASLGITGRNQQELREVAAEARAAGRALRDAAGGPGLRRGLPGHGRALRRRYSRSSTCW